MKGDTCRIVGCCSIKEERMTAISADELDMSVTIIDSQIIVTEEEARKDMTDARFPHVFSQNLFTTPTLLMNMWRQAGFPGLNIVA
jgi:hypothetical protein